MYFFFFAAPEAVAAEIESSDGAVADYNDDKEEIPVTENDNSWVMVEDVVSLLSDASNAIATDSEQNEPSIEAETQGTHITEMSPEEVLEGDLNTDNESECAIDNDKELIVSEHTSGDSDVADEIVGVVNVESRGVSNTAMGMVNVESVEWANTVIDNEFTTHGNDVAVRTSLPPATDINDDVEIISLEEYYEEMTDNAMELIPTLHLPTQPDHCVQNDTTEETVELIPTTEETVELIPTTEETVEPIPTTEETVEPIPTTEETVEPIPTTEETVEPIPTTEETVEPIPTTEETVEPIPTTEETVEPIPTTEETVEPIPTTEETVELIPTLQLPDYCVQSNTTEETVELIPTTEETVKYDIIDDQTVTNGDILPKERELIVDSCKEDERSNVDLSNAQELEISSTDTSTAPLSESVTVDAELTVVREEVGVSTAEVGVVSVEESEGEEKPLSETDKKKLEDQQKRDAVKGPRYKRTHTLTT